MDTFNIIDYLEEKGIEYITSGKNVGAGWVGIQCVFCGDTSFHLGCHVDSGGLNCWRCGKKDIISFIMKAEGCSKSEAFKILRRFSKFQNFEEKEQIQATEIEELKYLTKDFPYIHLRYLEERNFDADFLIKKYDLYAGTVVGDFKFRIVAPIYLNERIVSLVGRDITGYEKPKYKILSNEKSIVPAKHTLYNIDTVRENTIIISEGITDVWRIGDGCIATFGTKVTTNQINLLIGLKNAFILFDADAKEQAHKLAHNLSGIVKYVEVIELSKSDPADMTDQEVKYLRKELGFPNF